MKENFLLHKIGSKFKDYDTIIEIIGIQIDRYNIIYKLEDVFNNRICYLNEYRIQMLEEIK